MRVDYRDLKERIRLKDLLQEIAWKPIEGRGAQLRGPCPLSACQSQAANNPSPHPDRSFSVNTDKNVYRCFRCDCSGTVLDFWQQYRRTTLHAAAQELSTRTPLQKQQP